VSKPNIVILKGFPILKMRLQAALTGNAFAG
jgi:hypothetical protein